MLSVPSSASKGREVGHGVAAPFTGRCHQPGRDSRMTERSGSDRTGHTTSAMINRCRSRARTFAEAQLGELTPLNVAIPELARRARAGSPGGGPGPDVSGASTRGGGPQGGPRGGPRRRRGGSSLRPGVPRLLNHFSSVAKVGLEPTRPCGQRILSLARADLAEHEDIISRACDAGASTNERDGPPCGPPAAHPEAPQEAPSGALDDDPELVLVEALAEAVAQCRAAGRTHAARVAWEALGRLLASREQATSGATETGSSTRLVPLRREK